MFYAVVIRFLNYSYCEYFEFENLNLYFVLKFFGWNLLDEVLIMPEYI
jgi:hypothetical protein